MIATLVLIAGCSYQADRSEQLSLRIKEIKENTLDCKATSNEELCIESFEDQINLQIYEACMDIYNNDLKCLPHLDL
jgi:hypothetical protein